MAWDPDRYLRYADERGRPFVELVARIDATAPERVVDLGCGPGTLTELLLERWPSASVTGIDSSPEMIERARSAGRADYEVGDLAGWSGSADVIVSNAALQWVPGHLDLLPGLVGALRPGGWIALQVPGNFDEPSHAIRRELMTEAPYAEWIDGHTAGLPEPAAYDAETYLRALTATGCGHVDAWETTYLHVLHGEDPVFTWISGTSARPVLDALPDDLRPGFVAELKRRLAAAYPDDGSGVVLPFRRVFAVGRK